MLHIQLIIFMLEIKSSSPFFLGGKRKQSVDPRSDHCGTIFFSPMKGELFHLYPSLGCCPRVGDDHKRGKETRFVLDVSRSTHVLNCARNGHRMLGPATVGQKYHHHSILSPIKSFQSSPAGLVIIRGASASATWSKAILAVSRVLYLLLGVALPPTFLVDNLVLLYYCPSYFLSVFIIIHNCFVHF